MACQVEIRLLQAFVNNIGSKTKLHCLNYKESEILSEIVKIFTYLK